MFDSNPIAHPVQTLEVPGFPDYRASDDGTIWTRRRPPGGRPEDRGILLATWRECPTHHSGTMGSLAVSLTLDGRQTSKTVASIVLETFVGPRPAGLCARHANRLREDCRLANLRWDIQGRHLPKELSRQCIDQLRARATAGEPFGSLASAFNLDLGEVSRITRRLERVGT